MDQDIIDQISQFDNMNSNDKTNDKINQKNKKEIRQEEYWLTKRIKKDYQNLKNFLSEKKKTFFWVIVVFIAFITMDVLTIGQLMENNGLSVKNNMKGGVMIGGDDTNQETRKSEKAAKAEAKAKAKAEAKEQRKQIRDEKRTASKGSYKQKLAARKQANLERHGTGMGGLFSRGKMYFFRGLAVAGIFLLIIGVVVIPILIYAWFAYGAIKKTFIGFQKSY